MDDAARRKRRKRSCSPSERYHRLDKDEVPRHSYSSQSSHEPKKRRLNEWHREHKLSEGSSQDSNSKGLHWRTKDSLIHTSSMRRKSYSHQTERSRSRSLSPLHKAYKKPKSLIQQLCPGNLVRQKLYDPSHSPSPRNHRQSEDGSPQYSHSRHVPQERKCNGQPRYCEDESPRSSDRYSSSDQLSRHTKYSRSYTSNSGQEICSQLHEPSERSKEVPFHNKYSERAKESQVYSYSASFKVPKEMVANKEFEDQFSVLTWCSPANPNYERLKDPKLIAPIGKLNALHERFLRFKNSHRSSKPKLTYNVLQKLQKHIQLKREVAIEQTACIIDMDGFSMPKQIGPPFLCKELGVAYMYKNHSASYTFQVGNFNDLDQRAKPNVLWVQRQIHGMAFEDAPGDRPQASLEHLLASIHKKCITESGRYFVAYKGGQYERNALMNAGIHTIYNLEELHCPKYEVLLNHYKLKSLSTCGLHRYADPGKVAHCPQCETEIFRLWLLDDNQPLLVNNNTGNTTARKKLKRAFASTMTRYLQL